jgi:thymidylate kinase
MFNGDTYTANMTTSNESNNTSNIDKMNDNNTSNANDSACSKNSVNNDKINASNKNSMNGNACNKKRLRVICLEGCHGAGKTQVLKCAQELARQALQNILFIDEQFLNMKENYNGNINPQSYLMEQMWVNHWVSNMIKLKCEQDALANGEQDTIVFADRSPFSSIVYVNDESIGFPVQPLLFQIVELSLKGLSMLGIDVEVYTLMVAKNIIWKRIQERLDVQPERKLYRENCQKHFENVYGFYQTFGNSNKCKAIIKNDENDNGMQAANTLLSILSNK